MKVLQINATVNTTSTGRITEEIGQTLLDHGHGSYIAYSKSGPGGSGSHLIRIGNDIDFYRHGLKTRALDRHGFGSKKSTQDLVGQIKNIKPDVIGLHNLHGYYLNIEVLFKYLKNVQIPVIWTLHDCWPFTGHCSFFDYVSCEKWKTGCYECPLSNRYPASWFIDNSEKNYHQKSELFNGLKNLTIVTPSHWLAELTSQSFLSKYPVEVIPNGIDVDRFEPVEPSLVKAKYQLTDKKIILGVASVWDRRKGLDDFLQLSKQLDDHFRIVLIGLSEKTIRELPSNIIGIPRTENIDELISLYSCADVFVNPTLVDNFPTTNLEALACGTPVITYKTGGSPEAIDANTGLIVPKGDVGALHFGIREILKNGKSNYSKACRNRAIAYFNKEERFRDYLNLYENVRQGDNIGNYYAEG